MRVVHAAGWYFPESLGGTEVYVATGARELRRAGVDVCVAAPAPGARHAREEEHDGVPVFRYPVPASPTRAEARGDAIVRGAEWFHEWLAATRPDVVHMHTFVTGLDLIEVERARATGARVFVTSHSSALGYVCLRGTLLRWGTDVCHGLAQPRACAACALQQRGLSRRWASVAARLPLAAARMADRLDHPVGTGLGLPAYVEARMRRQEHLFEQIECFYALTDAARRILIANGAPSLKTRVNRLGIDDELIRADRNRAARPGRTPITIGYLGRLDPIKGVHDLIRAVESLEPDVPVRVEIRGAGDDAAAARLRDACTAAARRDPRLVIGAPVARHEVATLLASWDLVCCPGVSLEGGPTVALEAFAVGTPVIGTRLGGLSEIVRDRHNGRLFEPGDWRALADAIRLVAKRPHTIGEWRTNIPAVRSMREVAAEYLAAYSACVSSRRAC